VRPHWNGKEKSYNIWVLCIIDLFFYLWFCYSYSFCFYVLAEGLLSGLGRLIMDVLGRDDTRGAREVFVAAILC
jgi:hypothetical protein